MTPARPRRNRPVVVLVDQQRQWVAYDRPAMADLGLADHERIAGFVYIGTATKPPEDRERPKLESIVTYYHGAGR